MSDGKSSIYGNLLITLARLKRLVHNVIVYICILGGCNHG